MSQPKSNTQVYLFAVTVCVVCSVVLAGAATLLQPRQAVNLKLDIVKNILVAVGHDAVEIAAATPQANFAMYQAEFNELLVDKDNQAANGEYMKAQLASLKYPQEQLDGMGISDVLRVFNSKKGLLARRQGQSLDEFDPGYKLVHIWQPKGAVEAYVIPIEGYGLWDIIKGYVALEPDLNTIKGISFLRTQRDSGLGRQDHRRLVQRSIQR